MRKVEVPTGERAYSILVGAELERDLRGELEALPGAGAVAVVIDQRVGELHGARVSQATSVPQAVGVTHSVPSGEASKSAGELQRLYDYLAFHQVDRSGVVVAIGGGVTGDLAGFAAATWMRGLRWVAVPTTLLAAIDASVGGKTAVNHPAGKNLIGAFHQPEVVVVDLAFLDTLEERDYAAGLAESIKHALIADAAFLGWHEENVKGIGERDRALLEDLIARNCEIKAGIVAQDEREQHGRREALNFGHTIGHALENLLGYELRHGECVALGMLAAGEICRRRGLLSADDAARVRLLMGAAGLPTLLPRAVAADEVVAQMVQDKKVRGGMRRFVLLDGIGRCFVADDVTDEEVCAGLAAIG